MTTLSFGDLLRQNGISLPKDSMLHALNTVSLNRLCKLGSKLMTAPDDESLSFSDADSVHAGTKSVYQRSTRVVKQPTTQEQEDTGGIWDSICSFFSLCWAAVKDAACYVWDEVKAGFQAIWDHLKNAWNWLQNNLLDILLGVGGIVLVGGTLGLLCYFGLSLPPISPDSIPYIPLP